MNDARPHLSHLDDEGRARMIDVGDKPVTRRVAIAAGRLTTTAEVLALMRADGLPKADVLATARIAGIAAAKRTSELIPLAHPLPLDSVVVEFALLDASVEITATATVTGRTGVEMEALTAVAVAGLTLHDMVKAMDAAAVLGDIRLLEKSGGRHGSWTRDERPTDEPADPAPRGRAVVIVSSTATAAGERVDTTGPAIVRWLRDRGYTVDAPLVCSDADITTTVSDAVRTSPALLLTTGGTGIHPQDRTPEAAAGVIERELPGVAEALRASGRAVTPTAALSRAVAGVAGSTIVVTLPGSTGGVRDGLAVLDPLLPHLHDQLAGGGHG